jgi:molybdopterin converting factor small subunit
MIVKVRLFASFREIAKNDYIELELNEHSTYNDLVNKISEKLNVNKMEVKLLSGDEQVKLDANIDIYKKIIAFPPVAGG